MYLLALWCTQMFYGLRIQCCLGILKVCHRDKSSVKLHFLEQLS
jgi:hypothetical protein